MRHSSLTIRTASQQIAAREVTPSQLLDRCLVAIEKYEHDLCAWVCLDEAGTRAQARKLDAMLVEGQTLGPLHGVPVGIKDIVDVAGLPTKCGSKLRDNHVAKTDAEVVLQLRQAGAIIVGKTVTTEFACFDPPPTKNPQNVAHTPGGSSSGSAVAVATGMCLGAIGSQTGGSITRPASYCGVAGLKPTFGTIDRTGVFPVSDRLDHVGPICQTADDLSLMFSALTSPSVTDVTVKTIQHLQDFFNDEASADVRAVTTRAIDNLRQNATINTAGPLPESFANLHEHHYRIMAVEAAAVHRQQFAQQPTIFSPNIASLIETGLVTSPADYTASKQHQETFKQEIDAYLDRDIVLVMPATSTIAPRDLTTTGNPLFNSPWSYSGLPAVNIPIGTNDDGLPCGLQFVGARGTDWSVLKTAAYCEELLAAVNAEGSTG